MKKLLALMLLLVTVIILAIPTPALAWDGRYSGTSGDRYGSYTGYTQHSFTADAFLAVTGQGQVNTRYLGPYYIFNTTVGEEISGTITSSSGWDVAGLDIVFRHQSNTFINLYTMKITGTATGTITVVQDGSPVMTGSYSAFIRGDVAYGTSGLIYSQIYDSAAFSLSGVPGTDFAGTSAYGFGFADLLWNPVYQTLMGSMTLSGLYR